MTVAYVSTCFSSLSHTFLRREIEALRRRGLDVALFGVREDSQTAVPSVRAYAEQTQYLYPLRPARVAKALARYAIRQPEHFFRGLRDAWSSPEFSTKRRAKMVFHYLASVDLADQLERRGVRRVHAHFLNVSASLGMYAAHHARLPYSVTVHSAGTHGTAHIVGLAQKLRQAEFLVMISQHNVDYFDAIVPCRLKSHVVRCGMDLSATPIRSRELRVTDAPHLVAVGRFVEKKGFSYLLEALALLRGRGMAPTLTLLGDGPLRSAIERRCSELGLEDAVELLGRQPSERVKRAMEQADAVVVPSVTSSSGEKEGLPVVLMEAMALGVPVIATDHSGIPELVREGQTGWLVPEKDPVALADAVEQVARSPDDSRVRAGRRLVEQEFSIEVVADQLLGLFRPSDQRSQHEPTPYRTAS